VNLHVQCSGRGPDLVLLHGWALHSGVWKSASRELGERFRVHAVDLPGHGDSRGVEARTLDEATDAVAACVPRDAIVCGWSLGGLVAMKLALRSLPIRSLVLVSATPCFVQTPQWPHGLPVDAVEGFDQGIRENVGPTLERFMRLTSLHGARARETIRFLGQALAERELPSSADLLAALGWLREADLRLEAADIRVPALVLHGTRDAIAPVGAGRWLTEHLPRARLVEWDDAAHIPFFTHGEAFVRALESIRD
jgi:pimeloyl-[acyl-carrier protein] methyl ester esterase